MLVPSGLARASPSRGDLLRGDPARPRRARRHHVAGRQPTGCASSRRTTESLLGSQARHDAATPRAGASVATAKGERLLLDMPPPTAMTLGIGVEHVIETPAERGDEQRRRGSGRGGAHGRRAAGRADQGHQVRHLSIVVLRAALPSWSTAASGRSIGRSPMASTRCWRDSRRSSRASGIAPMSESPRRTTPRAAAGDPLEPLPGGAGNLARGGDGRAGEGLTGPAAEGYHFWDTEMYVLPMLSYTSPRIGATCCAFARACCPRRASALELSQRGALFPWRTIDG